MRSRVSTRFLTAFPFESDRSIWQEPNHTFPHVSRLFQSRILENSKRSSGRFSTRCSSRLEIYRVSTLLCAISKKKKNKKIRIRCCMRNWIRRGFRGGSISRCTRSSPRTPSIDETWSRTKSRIWSTSTTRLRISFARSPRISSSPRILIPLWCSSTAPRDCPRSRSLYGRKQR